MNHQVQNLSSFGLKFERFDICGHERECSEAGRELQDGRPHIVGRLDFVAGSTKLMDRNQDSFAFFDSCHRAKSAPSIKNFRPIWTIRICSSSMILRKCRTENPANSAAFGISRNVFFTTIPPVDFIGSSFVLEDQCTAGAKKNF